MIFRLYNKRYRVLHRERIGKIEQYRDVKTLLSKKCKSNAGENNGRTELIVWGKRPKEDI